jgi:hypothetical protein
VRIRRVAADIPPTLHGRIQKQTKAAPTESQQMNSIQLNKLNMYLAVEAVLDSHKDTWQTMPAFEAGATELSEHIANIQGLAQTQTSKNGGSAEKAQAFQTLVDSAYEIAAATRACAVASSNSELAAQADYSRSAVGDGRDSEVVARCQSILAMATANLASLADYGVTQAKLTALKKKIENFQAVQAKPRHNIATSSAATKGMPELFFAANEVLRDRLDGLVVQFRSTEAAFYNEYNGARVIVDSPGVRKVNGNGHSPAPAPAPEPVPA